MLCLNIFCAAVGDGTAVLSSGLLSLNAGTFPPHWRRVTKASACGKVPADVNLRVSSFRFMGGLVTASVSGFVY